MLKNKLILVKGAGDFASGSIRRLHIAAAKIVCTELPQPLTVRRMVAFAEAMYAGEHTVEGVTAVRATTDKINHYLSLGKVPILNDPETKILNKKKFDIVIDARMAKKNIGTKINDAPIVVALGPGFEAGKDCHAVIETLAGHNLGRVIYEGKAAENTGKPTPPELYLSQEGSSFQVACCSGFVPCCEGFVLDSLVLRAPEEGVFTDEKKIGELVKKGDIIGRVNGIQIRAEANGVIRGLIHDGVCVTKDLKIGDIDPTGEVNRAFEISEKANAVAGGVLEACLYLLNKKEKTVSFCF